MSEALLAPLAAWQNYYVIIGTAAATLTGLMFVVITLMAQLRVRPSSSWSHMRVFNSASNLPRTGPVPHRGGDDAAPVHGDPQCVGRCDLHGH
jgi:hypothetical protein